MRTRTLIGLLLAAAAGVAAIAMSLEGQVAPGVSPVPSVTNGAPRGLLAAFRYLEARGASPASVERDFAGGATEIAERAGVLVIAAPEVRALDDGEVEAALEVARRGGVLVVAAPTHGRLQEVQPALSDKLGARTVPGDREPPVLAEAGLGSAPDAGRDLTHAVTVLGPSPLTGRARRLAAEVRYGIEAEAGEVLAAAGSTPVIVRRPFGEGTVYLLSTPTLLENHRVDLADDPDLLEGLAALGRVRGGVAFDEVHHPPPPEALGGAWRSALLALFLQLGLVGLVFVAAAAPRTGPVRPLVVDRRRSNLEYVATLAGLYRRSASEAELVAEVHRDLRLRLLERYGLRIDAPDDQHRGPDGSPGRPDGSPPAGSPDDLSIAEHLEARAGVPPAAWLETAAALRAEPPDLQAALAAVARLEARLDGRKLGEAAP